MNDENVLLVDEFDNVIGQEEKLQAHRLGLLHRAFSVFVLRVHGGVVEVLLQQRQTDKYHCGGLWTNTCCSHPRFEEDVLVAGQRRLVEEMGFSVPLLRLGSFIYRAEFSNGLIEHELDHVLIGTYDGEINSFNHSEVAATKWVSVQDLQQDLRNNLAAYTPWLPLALEVVLRAWHKVNEIFLLDGAL